MAMAAAMPPPTTATATATAVRHASPFLHIYLSPLPITPARRRFRHLSAVVDGQAVVSTTAPPVSDSKPSPNSKTRPCELYVCNLPRSCDIAQLQRMFQPFGTVLTVEVSRNADTGVSKGCGYVTMSSINEAKAAITGLDGSDLDGREVRVRYSTDSFSRKKNQLNTTPRKFVIEGPCRAYVGNLPWSTKPDDLKAHFSQFGALVSARLFYDRKGGKNRVYGFISYSSPEEIDNAVASNGELFLGRSLVVKKIDKEESSS